MSADNIPVRADGQTIDQSWFNLLRTVLGVDIVPRDSSGNVLDLGGNLGQDSLRWLKAKIASGYFTAGDIKIHHSYNGAAPPGEGWMLCDGRQVTQSAYDTEHGSGHWTTYIGSSPIANKYLPDFTSTRYPAGVAATTQDGSAPITRVGVSGNAINLQHSHTVNSHLHGMNSHRHGLSGAVTPGSATGAIQTTGTGLLTQTDTPNNDNTTSVSPGTDNQLSASQSINPDSIEVQYYMRII